MARRIASDGFVTVSERRSTRKELMAREVYRRCSGAVGSAGVPV
jgi:hypothetical protein